MQTPMVSEIFALSPHRREAPLGATQSVGAEGLGDGFRALIPSRGTRAAELSDTPEAGPRAARRSGGC
jgi:hypothetical protein